MESPTGRPARAETFGCFRLQQEHVQISVWISASLGKFMDMQHYLVGGLIYTQNVMDSIFLSDLKTVLTFVFNNKVTQV